MPSGISTIISFITKYSGAGAAAAANGIANVQKSAKIGVRGMLALGAAVGDAGGRLGAFARHAMNMMWSIQQMGAIGGLMAGAQIAITLVADHFKKKADEMLAAVERMGEKVRDRLEKLNATRMNAVKDELEDVTVRAQDAAKAFDTMASAYMKVSKAKSETAKSGATAELSGLSLEKSWKMSKASSDDERATIGADYDVKIAKAKLENITGEQAALVASAEDELAHARRRSRASQRTEEAAKRALDKASATYDEDKNTSNTGNLEKSREMRDAAVKAYQEAVNDRVAKVAEAEAAEERLKQAKNAQTAALDDALREVVEAESAAKRLTDARNQAAEAERAAAEAARRKAAADERRAALEADRQNASSEVSHWRSEFERAFDIWRDPEAAASAVEADKRRAEDMKRYRREVNRYGGQGKIDEAARLMREGDEEGLQARLTMWRKSTKFTPQVEQLVKTAAIEQNRNAAEKSLAVIEKNTTDLAQKIDQLLQIK